MKVREAIAALERLDPDMEIYCIDGAESRSRLEGFCIEQGSGYEYPPMTGEYVFCGIW